MRPAQWEPGCGWMPNPSADPAGLDAALERLLPTAKFFETFAKNLQKEVRPKKDIRASLIAVYWKYLSAMPSPFAMPSLVVQIRPRGVPSLLLVLSLAECPRGCPHGLPSLLLALAECRVPSLLLAECPRCLPRGCPCGVPSLLLVLSRNALAIVLSVGFCADIAKRATVESFCTHTRAACTSDSRMLVHVVTGLRTRRGWICIARLARRPGVWKSTFACVERRRWRVIMHRATSFCTRTLGASCKRTLLRRLCSWVTCDGTQCEDRISQRVRLFSQCHRPCMLY